MNKTTKKMVTLATLITLTTTSGMLSPIKTFAETATVADQEQEKSRFELGPMGLQDALIQTGSHTLAMNLYAQTVIKTPLINLSTLDLGEEGKELDKKIQASQQIAIKNANYWLNTAKPKLNETSQSLVSYNTTFQNYYTTLVHAIDHKDTKSLTEGLNDLLDVSKQNKKEVVEVIKILQNFKEKLTIDTNQLKVGIDGSNGKPGIAAILTGKDALIPKLQEEIKQLEGNQREHFKKALGWSIGGGTGSALLMLTVIGGGIAIVVSGGTATPLIICIGAGLAAAGIGLGAASTMMAIQHFESYNTISEKIIHLNEDASLAAKAVLTLRSSKEHLTSLYETIDQAISTLTEMNRQWDKIGANYKGLIDSIDTLEEQNFTLLKEDLESVKKDWQDMKHTAELVAKDIAAVKNL